MTISKNHERIGNYQSDLIAVKDFWSIKDFQEDEMMSHILGENSGRI